MGQWMVGGSGLERATGKGGHLRWTPNGIVHTYLEYQAFQARRNASAGRQAGRRELSRP